jgi:hypothetical protein
MASTEHYEMIAHHIYKYRRVKFQLERVLAVVNPQAKTELGEASTGILIARITAELGHLGPEIKQQFSEVAADIIALKNEHDLNISPGHVPDPQKTNEFVNKSADVLAQLGVLQASLAKHHQ